MIRHRLISIASNAASLALLAIAISACGNPSAPLFKPNEADTQSEAGTTTIAVIAVEPWDNVAPSLQPDFALTPSQALDRVVPITAVLNERFLDAVGFKLGVGLPRSSVLEETITTLGADGTESTTGTTTERREPGTVPQPDTGVPANASSPALPTTTAELQIDPFIRYSAALSLYQEVQLINRYVRNAALKHGYEPYFVRFHISVSPYGRRRPYDVFTKISFFTPQIVELQGAQADPAKACRLPYVLPLIVTDNLEGTRSARAAEIARQLSLALNLMIKGVGAEAGLNALSENLKSIAGTDVNSLQSVSRLTDNSVQVRLGAARQPTAGYEMVARSYSFSTLVLVPSGKGRDAGCDQEMPEEIAIVAKSVWRNAESGEELPGPSEDEVVAKLSERLEIFLDEGSRKRWGALSKDKKSGIALELFNKVNTSSFPAFLDVLKKHQMKLVDSQYPYALWLDIADLAAQSRYASASVELPAREDPLAAGAVGQTLVLVDDEKSATLLRLHDIRGVSPELMNVRLHPHGCPVSGAPSVSLAPLAMAVAGAGRDLVLTFPSLKKLDLAPQNGQACLTVSQKSGAWTRGPVASSKNFADLLYMTSASQEKATFKLRTTVTAIKAEKNLAAVKLYVEDVTAEKVEIAFSNAEVESATSSPADALTQKQGKIILTKAAQLDLKLRNLVPQRPVQIEAKGTKDSKPAGGQTLVLEVN